jgi:uncharacterized membrane protein
MAAASVSEEGFPVSAGILFGLGLGGFFDGIVLHQILQWHHMLTSAGYPADSVENLQINTLWDGLFHASTYIFTAVGLWVLWRYSRKKTYPLVRQAPPRRTSNGLWHVQCC